MKSLRGGILLGATAAACSMGPTVEKFAPAREPAGVEVELRLQRHAPLRSIRGELITVGDSDFVVRDSADFWRVPFRAVRDAHTTTRGADRFIRVGEIGKSRWLALMSRYPQGMSDDVLRRLLAAYGRDSLRTVP